MKENVIGILAALCIVIFLLTLGLLKIKEDKMGQSQYEFIIESNMDKIPFGTSQICNVFEDYWAKDYPERMVLFYGRVQTLFGQPMYETEDLENQYSYWVYTVTEDEKIIYLNIYSASTGPAIGGFQDEESKKAADALVEMILQAEPADYEYRGYYFGDVVLEEHWTVKNGVASMEGKPLNLSEEEFIELFNRIHGLEEPEMTDQEPEDEKDYSYVYETLNVINLEKVRESWDDFYLERRSFGHEYEVEDRVTDDYIPKEIIDVLTALNNGNGDEETFAETYKNYLADDDISIDTYLEGDYIHIDPDDRDKIAEFADLDDLYFLHVFNVSSIMLADIDYDNEKECIAETYNDRNGATWFHIYDTKDGEVNEVYRIGPEPGVGKTELLKIDSKYFMLTNSYMGFYDPRNGSWTEVSVERNATAYTSHEFYSNTQLEDEKFLEGIDLMDANDSWKKQEKDFSDFYDSAHDPYNLYKPRVMEQKIEGEIYYYVLSDFSYHRRNDEYDRILFIIKETDNGKFEIVKAYYLVADLKLVIEEKDMDDISSAVS